MNSSSKSAPPSSIAVIVRTLASPPGKGAPTAPKMERLSKRVAARLLKPVKRQEASAATVADEIESSTTYTSDFTDKAPARSTVVEQLRVAAAWAAETDRAEAWAKYAQTMKELAFDVALRTTAAFAKEFRRAAGYDSSVGTKRYRETASFLGARGDAAARAAATLRKKRRAANRS